MYRALGLSVLFLFMSSAATAAILVDETWGSAGKTSASFSDVPGLRKMKKLGLATTLAGATGLLGLNLEINATPELSVSIGTGISRGFQAFNLNVKHFWGGQAFAPYFVGGFSRWYAHGDSDGVQQTSPSI